MMYVTYRVKALAPGKNAALCYLRHAIECENREQAIQAAMDLNSQVRVKYVRLRNKKPTKNVIIHKYGSEDIF